MERDRFVDIKERVNDAKQFTLIDTALLTTSDVLYLIEEVERLRDLLANYDDTYCRVWHIGDVNILGDK